jgi:hypothetical protein
MTVTLNFAFLREGTSDDGLIPHLRHLVVGAGADEAIGTARSYSGTVASKFRSLMDEPGSVDLVFVHRDADHAGGQARYDEIDEAVRATQLSIPVIPVVPIKELEAWLLIDEGAIRAVVGRPSGNQPLGLPNLKAIEKTSQPKELLEQACLIAAEKAGRRGAKEKRMFGRRRRALLERLDPAGPIRELPAWQRLEHDVISTVGRLVGTP